MGRRRGSEREGGRKGRKQGGKEVEERERKKESAMQYGGAENERTNELRVRYYRKEKKDLATKNMVQMLSHTTIFQKCPQHN